jgi:hypothetical protein
MNWDINGRVFVEYQRTSRNFWRTMLEIQFCLEKLYLTNCKQLAGSNIQMHMKKEKSENLNGSIFSRNQIATNL